MTTNVRTVTATWASRHVGQLPAYAKAGEKVLITYRGRPVARARDRRSLLEGTLA